MSWRRLGALARKTLAYLNVGNERKASKMLQHMQDEQWAQIRQQFAPSLRIILTETMLGKGWNLVQSIAGRLEGVAGKPLVTIGWLTTTVRIPLHFTRAKLCMNLQMSFAGNIIGLRFLPYNMGGIESPWQAAVYALAALHRESELQLGPADYKVGATLTLPKNTGQYPCVVLISGSGPCDRDSTVGAAKPFKDIALGLANQGIAVLRFDKVTHTHSKAFDNSKVTLGDEYMVHTLHAISLCTEHAEIIPNQIFVVGHSLGAWIAPRVAELEASVAGCVVMAAPAQPLYRSALQQLLYFASLNGASDQHLKTQIEELQHQADKADSEDLDVTTPASELPFGIGPRYWLDCRDFDPIGTANRLKKPVLILQGGRDYQVTIEHDYMKWQAGLKDNENVEFHVYEKLNHLFVVGEGPSTPREYDTPGHVDEAVIQDIANWVLKRCDA